MTIQIVNVFGKIILMIALGFVTTKIGIMTGDMKKLLSNFLMKIVLPINIISSACQKYSAANGIGMLKVLLISAVYYAAALFILTVICKKRIAKDKKAIFINLSVFANVGFIGFPLLQELLGNVGTLYTVAYNMAFQLFFFTYGMFLMKNDGELSVKAIFKNSIIYFSIASIALYFSQLRFPEFVDSALSSVGAMMVPLSMIIIGYEIAAMDMRRLYRDKMAYIVSFIRLVAAPVLMLIAMKILGIQHDVAVAVTILTALPSGSLTVIAAEDYGMDTAQAACAVAQSTVLMVVTLPIVVIFSEFIL